MKKKILAIMLIAVFILASGASCGGSNNDVSELVGDWVWSAGPDFELIFQEDGTYEYATKIVNSYGYSKGTYKLDGDLIIFSHDSQNHWLIELVTQTENTWQKISLDPISPISKTEFLYTVSEAQSEKIIINEALQIYNQAFPGE